jgi:hypothetical protein
MGSSDNLLTSDIHAMPPVLHNYPTDMVHAKHDEMKGKITLSVESVPEATCNTPFKVSQTSNRASLSSWKNMEQNDETQANTAFMVNFNSKL